MLTLPPLVSVIIPTYNRGSLIKETIESVLQQTYHNYELIIVDDASTDKTADWIAENYPQLQLIRLSQNLGNAGARNKGLQVAQGDFIAFLDHDDRWLPTYLLTQVATLQSHPTAVLSYCDYFEIREDNSKYLHNLKPWSIYPDFTYHLLMQNVIHSLSLAVMRKSALLEVGFFNESLRICNDIELYLRFSIIGTIIHLPQALVCKYNHQDNLCHKYWLWYQDLLKVYSIFFSQSFSHPYSHLQGQIKCHGLVTLFKFVWKYQQDYLFALVTQSQALIYAPRYRLQLLTTRWRKKHRYR